MEIIKAIIVVTLAMWLYVFTMRVLGGMVDPFEEIIEYFKDKFRKDGEDDGQEPEEKERIE